MSPSYREHPNIFDVHDNNRFIPYFCMIIGYKYKNNIPTHRDEGDKNIDKHYIGYSCSLSSNEKRKITLLFSNE